MQQIALMSHDLIELLKAKRLFTSAAGNDYYKVNGSLISQRGHKPEGLVEHERLSIAISAELICFHHFQLTPLIAFKKWCIQHM